MQNQDDTTGEISSSANLSSARQLVEQGKSTQAIDRLGQILAHDPTCTEALALLQQILDQIDDPMAQLPTQAEAESEPVLACVRAQILAHQASWPEAFATVSQLALTDPTSAYLDWTVQWLLKPQVAQSIPLSFLQAEFLNHLLQIIEDIACPMDPADPRQQTVALALQLCAVFRQHHPQDWFLHFAQSTFARRLGLFNDAIGWAKTAYDLEHNWTTAVGLACAQRDGGNIDQAIASYREASRLDPSDLSCLLDIGDLFLAESQFSEAIAAYQRVLEQQPEHPWAKPSYHFACYKNAANQADKQALLDLADSWPDNERVSSLVEEIVKPLAYIDYLPWPGDASAKAVMKMMEAMQHTPPVNRTGQLNLRLNHLESPSVMVACEMEANRLQADITLNIQIDEVQQPDPRIPKAEVAYQVWTYTGSSPSPNVDPPDPAIARRVAELAATDYRLEQWLEHAADLACEIGPDALPSLMGVMVHPPPPSDANLSPMIWIQRVQVASALSMAHLDSGWEASLRQNALFSLALGPVDWTTNAALIALSRLAISEPQTRKSVERLYNRLYDELPAETCYTCYEYALVCSWLSLPKHDKETLAWLEEWREGIEEEARLQEQQNQSQSTSVPSTWATNQPSPHTEQHDDPDDPLVFPAENVARLSHYVTLTKLMRAGQMEQALAHFALAPGDYAHVVQAWAAKLAADPIMNAKYKKLLSD